MAEEAVSTVTMSAWVEAAAAKAAADPGLPTWLKAALAVAAVLLSSSVIAAAFGALRADAARRREEYGAAAKVLTAWAEYPYRVRRRTSEDKDTLSALAARGHDLQELLADRAAWCAAEHPVMGRLFAHLQAELSRHVGPAVSTAWGEGPVVTAKDMVLNGSFVVNARTPELHACFVACVRERFGVRRLRPGLEGRVQQALTRAGLPRLP